MHDVEHPKLWINRREQCRQDGEILGHVVGDGKGGQRPARHQQLLADLHHVQQLGRVAVEVDHVGRFTCRLGAIVHRHANVSLGQGRGVVGAVTTHGHQTAVVLFLTDARQLFLRRGFGQHIIDACLRSNRRRGQRVVTGHHDGADPQLAQFGKTLANPGLDHVLEVDRAQQSTVGADQQRRAAALGDLVDFPRHRWQQVGTLLTDKGQQ